jgi:hypothetical protein
MHYERLKKKNKSIRIDVSSRQVYMKKNALLFLFFFVAALTFAKSPYDSYYDSLPSLPIELERVEEWQIPEKSVNILDYKKRCEKTYFKELSCSISTMKQ